MQLSWRASWKVRGHHTATRPPHMLALVVYNLGAAATDSQGTVGVTSWDYVLTATAGVNREAHGRNLSEV